MNIYKVEAFFEDFESSYSLIIGLFTDEKNAEVIKYKWLNFFKGKEELFNKPEDWNPKSDQWWCDDESEFDWFCSYDYQTLISKYRYIKNFSTNLLERTHAPIFYTVCYATFLFNLL